MRNCPACDKKHGKPKFSMDYKIPDGWTLPRHLDWYECACGMIYADNPDLTQSMLDEYYMKHYGFGLDTPANRERLEGLADTISRYYNGDTDKVIYDFGGGDGHLVDCLKWEGFSRVSNWNIGYPQPEQEADMVIASHVFEHIYDLDSVMCFMQDVVTLGGTLMVELPDALHTSIQKLPPIFDFHPRHINHFNMYTLSVLARRYGFYPYFCTTHEGINGFKNIRNWFINYGNEKPLDRTHYQMSLNLIERLSKLIKIGKPVIVWGLADFAWHILAETKLQIAGFVDMDPAYRGQTIDGIPVLDHVETDDPILIMVSNPERGQEIVDTIRQCGYPNEVIVV